MDGTCALSQCPPHLERLHCSEAVSLLPPWLWLTLASNLCLLADGSLVTASVITPWTKTCLVSGVAPLCPCRYLRGIRLTAVLKPERLWLPCPGVRGPVVFLQRKGEGGKLGGVTHYRGSGWPCRLLVLWTMVSWRVPCRAQGWLVGPGCRETSGVSAEGAWGLPPVGGLGMGPKDAVRKRGHGVSGQVARAGVRVRPRRAGSFSGTSWLHAGPSL